MPPLPQRIPEPARVSSVSATARRKQASRGPTAGKAEEPPRRAETEECPEWDEDHDGDTEPLRQFTGPPCDETFPSDEPSGNRVLRARRALGVVLHRSGPAGRARGGRAVLARLTRAPRVKGARDEWGEVVMSETQLSGQLPAKSERHSKPAAGCGGDSGPVRGLLGGKTSPAPVVNTSRVRRQGLPPDSRYPVSSSGSPSHPGGLRGATGLNVARVILRHRRVIVFARAAGNDGVSRRPGIQAQRPGETQLPRARPTRRCSPGRSRREGEWSRTTPRAPSPPPAARPFLPSAQRGFRQARPVGASRDRPARHACRGGSPGGRSRAGPPRRYRASPARAGRAATAGTPCPRQRSPLSPQTGTPPRTPRPPGWRPIPPHRGDY